MTFIVGLTGGIGCGKTVVSDYLASLGVPIIDTDVIARQVVEPNSPTLKKLADEFGDHILDKNGGLDRDALRKTAFASSAAKSNLDAITHPAIRAETACQIAEVKYPYCVVVIPLLTASSAFTGFLDRVVSVSAPQSVRVARVMKRNGFSEAEVMKIVQSQISDAERAAFSDDIIDNNGTIAQARERAHELHTKYLELASIANTER